MTQAATNTLERTRGLINSPNLAPHSAPEGAPAVIAEPLGGELFDAERVGGGPAEKRRVSRRLSSVVETRYLNRCIDRSTDYLDLRPHRLFGRRPTPTPSPPPAKGGYLRGMSAIACEVANDREVADFWPGGAAVSRKSFDFNMFTRMVNQAEVLRVPDNIELHPVPPETANQGPQAKSHSFFVKDGDNAIVLVSPTDRRVADVIPEAPTK